MRCIDDVLSNIEILMAYHVVSVTIFLSRSIDNTPHYSGMLTATNKIQTLYLLSAISIKGVSWKLEWSNYCYFAWLAITFSSRCTLQVCEATIIVPRCWCVLNHPSLFKFSLSLALVCFQYVLH